MDSNTAPKMIDSKIYEYCKLEPTEINLFVETNNTSAAASLEWLLDAGKKKRV